MERPRINYKKASAFVALTGAAAVGLASVSGVFDQNPDIKGTVVGKAQRSYTNRTLFLVTPWQKYPLWTEPSHEDYILKVKECDVRKAENDCDTREPIDVYVSAETFGEAIEGQYADFSNSSDILRVER